MGLQNYRPKGFASKSELIAQTILGETGKCVDNTSKLESEIYNEA
jgi:hypothetical protein